MFNVNQQQSGSSTNQLHFSPVSRSFSNMGTTVSYSLIPTASINASNCGGLNNISAYNTNLMGSGQFVGNYSHPAWNAMGYSAYTPMVSSSQYNQMLSGSYVHPLAQFTGNRIVQPGVDISETASDVVITASVSNLGVNNLNLNATENSVTISGTAWTGNESVVLNRTVALPTSIRAESIDANFQSGVLEIRCPKTEKLMRQRTTISTDSMQQGIQGMQAK